jgi:hypothetical protein
MPIARMDLMKGNPASYDRTISHIGYQAMVLNAPTDDRFQVFAEPEAENLIYPASFWGMETQLSSAPTVA